jgi:hypothetical protein
LNLFKVFSKLTVIDITEVRIRSSWQLAHLIIFDLQLGKNIKSNSTTGFMHDD